MYEQKIKDRQEFILVAEKKLHNFEKIFAFRYSNCADNQIKFEVKKAQINKEYAMMYLCKYNMCCVWDIAKHRTSSCNLSVSILASEAKKKLDKNNGLWDYYKEVRGASPKGLEKVLFFQYDYIHYFLEHYKILMSFNEYDVGFPRLSKVQYSENYTMIERKKYSTSQWKRDHDFRFKVLKSYGYKCAVCRCGIQEVLQAAHERNYEVRNTNIDDYRHGICLCANHHLMYDSKLIDIDLVNLNLHYNNKDLKKMLCFKDFNEKYRGKIIKQTILQEDKIL